MAARAKTPKVQQSTGDAAVAPVTVFDLASRRMRDTLTFPLRDPATGDETGATITIHSPRSKPIHEAAKRRPVMIADGKIAMSDEDFTEALTERAIAAVASWDGITEHGVTLPCDEPTVRRVLTEPGYFWVAEQIRSQLMAVADFFGVPRSV